MSNVDILTTWEWLCVIFSLLAVATYAARIYAKLARICQAVEDAGKIQSRHSNDIDKLYGISRITSERVARVETKLEDI